MSLFASIRVGREEGRVSDFRRMGLGAGKLGALCEQKTQAVWDCHTCDKTGFEAFVNRYMKDAYFIALGLVGNQDDALELSQEAFLKAYRSRSQLSSAGKLLPWFYRILRNLCFSHLRKRKVQSAESLDGFEDRKSSIGDCARFDPQALADRDETTARVWKAIGRLDDKHKEVIILRHFRNLSYEQMAELLFCNKGTVTSRLYYARKRLKDILDSEKGGLQQ